MASPLPASEWDVLSQVVMPEEKDLGIAVARALLELRFAADAQANIRDLLERSNRGALSDADRETLAGYLRVGKFLDVLQAKARLTLEASCTKE